MVTLLVYILDAHSQKCLACIYFDWGSILYDRDGTILVLQLTNWHVGCHLLSSFHGYSCIWAAIANIKFVFS